MNNAAATALAHRRWSQEKTGIERLSKPATIANIVRLRKLRWSFGMIGRALAAKMKKQTPYYASTVRSWYDPDGPCAPVELAELK